jgi:hypothetical protein
MDHQTRFIAVFGSLTHVPSRRDVLRGLVAAGLGLGALRLPDAAVARKRKKRRNKKKPAGPNGYGCRSVGVACTSADECCSSTCEGNRCRAHGTGICKQGVQGACSATSVEDLIELTCHGAYCFCVRTTAGSNFCSAGAYTDGSSCANCTTDADCEELGFPAGSACAPVSAGICGACPSGKACLAPCDYEASASESP